MKLEGVPLVAAMAYREKTFKDNDEENALEV